MIERLYGDCRSVMAELADGSVQQIVTSPPYLGQRVYGADPNEIGWGSLTNYLDQLGEVLDQAWRILDPDGTCWFVLGDKAAGSGGAGGDHSGQGSKHWIPSYGKIETGLNPGQWTMVPYRFAAMAQDRDWLVRTIIVWDKSPNVKPEDMKHTNRPMISTERIVVLAKHTRHRFFPARLVEKGDVWHIKPQRGKGAARHFAPFPAEIPLRAILAASERGDTILDPFVGSGTTLNVAADLGRNAIGIDLYRPGEAP